MQNKNVVSSPKISFQNPVHVLVKRPGGVVAGPVMIVSISVGEEIAGKRREESGLGLLLSCTLFSELGEVIFEGSELELGVQLRLRVDVVEQLLVVVELCVPLTRFLKIMFSQYR
jgi:hypothetical protein